VVRHYVGGFRRVPAAVDFGGSLLVLVLIAQFYMWVLPSIGVDSLDPRPALFGLLERSLPLAHAPKASSCRTWVSCVTMIATMSHGGGSCSDHDPLLHYWCQLVSVRMCLSERH
jgi:hypothetical protein